MCAFIYESVCIEIRKVERGMKKSIKQGVGNSKTCMIQKLGTIGVERFKWGEVVRRK